MNDNSGPGSDPGTDPPPEPDDFVDFLQEKSTRNPLTFDNSMLADIADNGLEGKFKDTYKTWFNDKVILEVMEDDAMSMDKDEDKDK